MILRQDQETEEETISPLVASPKSTLSPFRGLESMFNAWHKKAVALLPQLSPVRFIRIDHQRNKTNRFHLKFIQLAK